MIFFNNFKRTLWLLIDWEIYINEYIWFNIMAITFKLTIYSFNFFWKIFIKNAWQNKKQMIYLIHK